MAFALPTVGDDPIANYESSKTMKVKSPPGTKVGHLLVAELAILSSSGEVSTATGWTRRGEVQKKGSRQVVFYTRTAEFDGEHEYPIVLSASKEVLWACARVEGVSEVQAAVVASETGTTIFWPAATPTEKPTMDLLLAAFTESEDVVTPAGFTAVYNEPEGVFALFWRELTTTAGTGETGTTKSSTFPAGTLRLILLGEERELQEGSDVKLFLDGGWVEADSKVLVAGA